MKTNIIKLFLLFFTSAVFSQAGHIMQGVGAVNMSMGGAATAQPLDIIWCDAMEPSYTFNFRQQNFKT